MDRLYTTLLMCTLLLGLLSLAVAEETAPDDPDTGAREKRSMPNWALTSSDFFGWMEYLRAHAAYDKMGDLARTFWAHFPSANDLGYETSELE